MDCMKTKIAAVFVAVVVVGMAFGASAFTTATIDRSANIQVSSDSGGIIGLAPDADASMVSETTGGELSIDVSGPNGEGVNVNSQYTIGDSTDPVNVSAFSVTNNDAAARNVTFSYAVSGTDSAGATNNVQYTVYDSTSASQGTFSEGGSVTLNSMPSGATYYVVLTVDTTNSATTDDLSGTLTIKAE